MSVTPEVKQFMHKSLANNNKALLDQISKLVADSSGNVKRASVEATGEQLREIKNLTREEPKSLNRKVMSGSVSSTPNGRIPLKRPNITLRSMRSIKQRRPGNCFACDKFGHWRSAECVQSARGSKGNRDSR